MSVLTLIKCLSGGVEMLEVHAACFEGSFCDHSCYTCRCLHICVSALVGVAECHGGSCASLCLVCEILQMSYYLNVMATPMCHVLGVQNLTDRRSYHSDINRL